jgi:hypothetical protein
MKKDSRRRKERENTLCTIVLDSSSAGAAVTLQLKFFAVNACRNCLVDGAGIAFDLAEAIVYCRGSGIGAHAQSNICNGSDTVLK